MTGKQLKDLRQRLGWTQVQLAKAVGIAPNNIALQERGKIGISEPVARLILIVAAGVDVESIVDPRRGRKGASHKPPKGAGPRSSKGASRQKDHVQRKRR